MIDEEAAKQVRLATLVFFGVSYITHDGSVQRSEFTDSLDDASDRARLETHGQPEIIGEVYIYQHSGLHRTLEGSWGWKDGYHCWVPSGKAKQRRFLEHLKQEKEEAPYVFGGSDDEQELGG